MMYMYGSLCIRILGYEAAGLEGVRIKRNIYDNLEEADTCKASEGKRRCSHRPPPHPSLQLAFTSIYTHTYTHYYYVCFPILLLLLPQSPLHLLSRRQDKLLTHDEQSVEYSQKEEEQEVDRIHVYNQSLFSTSSCLSSSSNLSPDLLSLFF